MTTDTDLPTATLSSDTSDTSEASGTPDVSRSAPTTFSTLSLVLGITGIALGQGLLAVAAIVLGFVARSREPQAVTTANWGIVLGFVGTFGGLILGLLGLAAFLPFAFGLGAFSLTF